MAFGVSSNGVVGRELEARASFSCPGFACKGGGAIEEELGGGVMEEMGRRGDKRPADVFRKSAI